MAAGPAPAAVFHKMGLRQAGLWPFPRPAHRVGGISAAARFRDAIEELGGLYLTFGQFLSWRADLLRADYLSALRHVRRDVDPLPREDAVRVLCTYLGLKGERLAANLQDPPLWSTVARCAWRSEWEGRPMVVQIARPPVGEAEWDRFERGVRKLREPGLATALSPEVLHQYRIWLHITDSAQRERSYLDSLSSFNLSTLVEYPRLEAELCAAEISCWPWVEGEPLDQMVRDGVEGTARKIAEALLEQVCLVSVVDAEWDLASMVLTPEGRVAMRRANRLISIPAALTRTVLKYVSSVLAGNSTYANRQLVRMVMGYASAQMESRLFDALSNLEPELKINLRFPPSAGTFESNWRAVARISEKRPVYLDTIHRNLVAVGYWDAEAAPRGSTPDSVAEAQWPVLGRLMRARLGEFTSGDMASQWVMGSGLLVLESMRQVARMAEGFRDNDLSFTFAPALSEEASRQANRAMRTAAVLAILLMIFLICLRWGPKTPAPWSGIATVVAVVSAAGLLWILARIG